MAAVLTHPPILPVKRETTPIGTKPYTARGYHAPSIVDTALKSIKKAPVEESCSLDDGAVQAHIQIDIVHLHFDRRIQLFLIHLITCWKTPFEFSIKEANEQFGKGENVKLKTQTGREIAFKTRAAHSSTLPGLLFRRRGSDDLWSVYLKGSHTSHAHNATVEFHDCLNNADSELDGKQEDSKRLRYHALKLINHVAQNQLHPIAAMHRFMKSLVSITEKRRDLLSEEDPRHTVLSIYLERAQDVQDEISSDPGYFDVLLSLKLEGYDQELKLRQAVYKTRFKLIRDIQLVETQIAEEILKVNTKITGSKTKSMAKIDSHLRYHLLNQASNYHQRCLNRILCVSTSTLLGLRPTTVKQTVERRNAFYTENREDIDALSHTLHRYIYSMNRIEIIGRSEAIRGIRHVRGWTQKETAEIYKEGFPEDTMSPSTYCRLEGHARADTKLNYDTPESQRKQPVTYTRALHLADTFDVDPGLILPSIVSSNY